MKQAVNDTMEQLSDQPPEYIRRLDDALRAKSLVTFSELRRRYGSAYRRILKRKTIKTETEYYLVAGVLADCSSLATAEERAVLEELVAAFGKDA